MYTAPASFSTAADFRPNSIKATSHKETLWRKYGKDFCEIKNPKVIKKDTTQMSE